MVAANGAARMRELRSGVWSSRCRTATSLPSDEIAKPLVDHVVVAVSRLAGSNSDDFATVTDDHDVVAQFGSA